jgi:hypothetical protein
VERKSPANIRRRASQIAEVIMLGTPCSGLVRYTTVSIEPGLARLLTASSSASNKENPVQ